MIQWSTCCSENSRSSVTWNKNSLKSSRDTHHADNLKSWKPTNDGRLNNLRKILFVYTCCQQISNSVHERINISNDCTQVCPKRMKITNKQTYSIKYPYTYIYIFRCFYYGCKMRHCIETLNTQFVNQQFNWLVVGSFSSIWKFPQSKNVLFFIY